MTDDRSRTERQEGVILPGAAARAACPVPRVVAPAACPVTRIAVPAARHGLEMLLLPALLLSLTGAGAAAQNATTAPPPAAETAPSPAAATSPPPAAVTSTPSGAATSPRAAAANPARGQEANRVEVGFEERLRQENWNNLLDFDCAAPDKRSQFRFRERLWARFNFSGVELALGLDNESRSISVPDLPFVWDETVVETGYAEYKAKTWSARLGRQDLQRGEGFILFDGTPLDGSRTAYVNALDAAWTPAQSRLDLIAISDPAHDTYFFRLADTEKPLIEWNERALGLYYTESAPAKTRIEAYYFFKTERTDEGYPPSAAARPRDRRIHTLGGRLVQQLGAGWSATGELAGQWGRAEDEAPIGAWGGYAYGKKEFETAARPSVLLGWIGLSGDDPSTERVEGWDPLFSRWPKWSELMIYSLATEGGVAYWSNLSMGKAEFLIAPAKPLALRATWYRLGAFRSLAGASPNFGEGKVRGDLYQVRADWKAGSALRGHVLYERQVPGSFYGHGDPAWFFRAEVIITLKGTRGL